MWALLYSFNQKWFHVERMEEAIKSNLKHVIGNDVGSDYKIIFVSETQDEALNFAAFIEREYNHLVTNIELQ